MSSLPKIRIYLLSALLLTSVLVNSALAQIEKKVAYGILIDNTGSLRSQFAQVLELSKGIVGRTQQGGLTSLFNFQTQGDKKDVAVVASGIAWSQDRNLLNNYIDNLYVVPGQTKLKDAINAVAEQINKKAALDKDLFGDKIIFLITDGEDRSSKIKDVELIKFLKESHIKVYAIGLVRALDNNSGLLYKGSRAKAVAFLEKLTKETGGRAVFPKAGDSDDDKLMNELFSQ